MSTNTFNRVTTVRGAPDLREITAGWRKSAAGSRCVDKRGPSGCAFSLQNTATLCLRSLAPAYKAAGSHATAYKGTNEGTPKVRKATHEYLEYQ